MGKRTGIGLFLFFLGALRLAAQSDTTHVRTSTAADTFPVLEKSRRRSPVKLHGYVKDLSTIAIPSLKGDWYFDHLIHNRLNFKWYASEHITLTLEARSRLFFGESIKNSPYYGRLITQSLDYLRAGGVVAQERSFLLYSAVDRANVSWSRNNWQITLGKQRINWSKSYVWNPNDWFNAYSFFDFDYQERRGTDALLIKYTLGALSSVELASNAEKHFDHMITAGIYRFNQKEYDFQLLLGKYQTDIAIGGGWAGQIEGAGFKGELTYFQPYRTDTVKATLLGDVSLEYTFPSTFTLRLEAIANSNPAKGDGLLFLTQPVTAKRLTFNYLSLFGAVGHQITPLLSANLGSIWNVDDESFFVNPTLTFSLNDNTELLLASQIFSGNRSSLFYGMGSYVFTRLKWNF